MDPHPTNLELSAYHDGELDAARRAEIDRHLLECAACLAQLSELQLLSGMFASAPMPALSEAGFRRVHAKVDSAMEQGIIRLARVLSAVAACIVLIGSFWLTRVREQPSAAPPWIMPQNVEEVSADNVSSPVGDWYLADASSQQRPDEP